MSNSPEELLTGYIAPDEEVVDAKTYRSEDGSERRVLGVTDRRIIERRDSLGESERERVDIQTSLFTGPHVTGIDINRVGESQSKPLIIGGGIALGLFGTFLVLGSLFFAESQTSIGSIIRMLFGSLLVLGGILVASLGYQQGDDANMEVTVRTAEGAETRTYHVPPSDTELAASISEAIGAAHQV